MQRSTPTVLDNSAPSCAGLALPPGSARPKSPSAPDWRKSSRRGNTNCLEVALGPKSAAIRDSKGPTGPVLVVSAAAFGEFVAGLRSRRLLARG
ncbi:DUF397 domain-containing protein [Saccharopolyspora sp. ASAGF58]|nr:DUF397 domain-containing protein [Saccharopolyspora sp. ASAGF58]